MFTVILAFYFRLGKILDIFFYEVFKLRYYKIKPKIMSTITIKNTVTGKIIATGKLGSDVQNFEGNYYFKSDLVDLN